MDPNSFRYGPERITLVLLLGAQIWLLRRLKAPKLWALISLALGGAALLVSPAAWASLAQGPGQYLRAFLLVWALSAPYFQVVLLLARREHRPGRRRAMQALAAAPLAFGAYGVAIGRRQFHVREQIIRFPNLPPSLDGATIVQLSDIHYGPFLSAVELQRVIGLANDLAGDWVAVTGDLITRTPERLEECLRHMSALRGRVLGCMGNHEGYAACQAELATRAARLGWKFLRQESFDAGLIRFSGVDYQWRRSDYLRAAESLLDPARFNVLLAHNPDVFPRAAALGFDLTLSGHTHGGQVDVELLDQHWNVVRVFTPYTNGLYERNGRQCFVTAGVGTIGVPLRIGAPPEVALIRLCAS